MDLKGRREGGRETVNGERRTCGKLSWRKDLMPGNVDKEAFVHIEWSGHVIMLAVR